MKYSPDMLATRIRKIRMIRGWKQSNVASDMNITQQAYSFFEKAHNSPRIDTLDRFCKIMKIEISFLLAFEIPITQENIDKYGTKGLADFINEHKTLRQKLEFFNNLNSTNTLNPRAERSRFISIAAGQ